MMPSLQEFGLRYCDGKKSNWGWDFTGSSNLEELNIFMSANFMIRRLKVRINKKMLLQCYVLIKI